MEDMNMKANETIEIEDGMEVEELCESSCGSVVAGFVGGILAIVVAKVGGMAAGKAKTFIAKKKAAKMLLEDTDQPADAVEDADAES